MPLRKNTVAKKLDMLDINKAQARYDNAAKTLLSDKYILAAILKGCVEEIREYDIELIRDKFIENEPLVSKRAVDAGATDRSKDRKSSIGKCCRTSDIRGRNVEISSVTEGLIKLDVVSDIKIPDSKKEKYAIMNVEAQKNSNVGYPLPKRGNYYTGRLISSQKNTIFKNSEYGKLRKVFSIWIIMDVGKRKKNTITIYETNERHICGRFKEQKDKYDLQTIIMIGLGEYTKTDNKLLKLLDVLFAKDISAPEKQRLLEEMGYKMTEKVKKEVNTMCNLGEGIFEQGMDQGTKQGMKRGIDIGEEKKEKAMLSNMILSGKLSLEDISETTGVDIKKVKQVSEELSAVATVA